MDKNLGQFYLNICICWNLKLTIMFLMFVTSGRLRIKQLGLLSYSLQHNIVYQETHQLDYSQNHLIEF